MALGNVGDETLLSRATNIATTAVSVLRRKDRQGKMAPPSVTAFVSARGFTLNSLSRRPRAAKCDCFVPSGSPVVSRHSLSKRATIMQAGEPGDAELAQEFPSGDISSTNGFALRDSPINMFVDLSDRHEAFARGGAYAIRDTAGQLCYMGYSKNVAAKLAFHARLLPEKCASFQVYVPPVPQELISPEMLENVLEYWVRENGGVPTGNTVDRVLWEQENPMDRKTEAATEDEASGDDSDVPVRERTTPRRTSRRERSGDMYEDTFVDNFRSSTGSAPRRHRKDKSGTWDAGEDDYVELEVDPLDPFSASRKRRSTRSSWDLQAENDEFEEDWVPIIALMGCAGLIWAIGMLSNALPAATPSLGM